MGWRKPWFVIAMDNEAAAVTAHLADARERVEFGRRIVTGTFGGTEVNVVAAGIGKDNAAAATQLALSAGADVIVNVGVAGALLPEMKVADVYRVRAAVEYDFDLAAVNGTKVGTLNECAERELPLVCVGPWPDAVLGTGDRFNDSEADFLFLRDDVRATLRDMEGAAVAHVAGRAGVPVVSVKSVSDVHGSGSTIDQYLVNLTRALETLSAAVPVLLNEIRT